MSIILRPDSFGRLHQFKIKGETPSATEEAKIGTTLQQRDEEFKALGPSTPVNTNDQPGFMDRVGVAARDVGLSFSTAGEQAARAAGYDPDGWTEYNRQVREGINKDQANMPGFLDQFGQGEILGGLGSLVADNIPSMAPTIAGGAAGAAIGSAILPGPGTAVGALLGGAGAALPMFFGSNIERQIAEGKNPEEVDRAAAILAAIPQAALDTIINRIFPGSGRIIEDGVLTTFGRELAEQGMLPAIAKRAAADAGIEAGTEVAQQGLERGQAGLELTSDDAMREYLEAGLAGGILGAGIGGAGKYAEVSSARKAVADEKAAFGQLDADLAADQERVDEMTRRAQEWRDEANFKPALPAPENGIAGLLPPPQTNWTDPRAYEAPPPAPDVPQETQQDLHGFVARGRQDGRNLPPDAPDPRIQPVEQPDPYRPGFSNIPADQIDTNMAMPSGLRDPFGLGFASRQPKVEPEPAPEPKPVRKQEDTSWAAGRLRDFRRGEANMPPSDLRAAPPPIVTRTQFSEAEFQRILGQVRDNGKVDKKQLTEQTGLRGKKLDAILEAMAERGDAVKETPKSYRPSEQISSERQQTPETEARKQDTVSGIDRSQGTNTNYSVQSGTYEGGTPKRWSLMSGDRELFTSPDRAAVFAHKRGLSKAQQRGTRIVGHRETFAVMEQRTDADGNVVTQAPKASFDTREEADKEARRLRGEPEPQPEPKEPGYGGGESREKRMNKRLERARKVLKRRAKGLGLEDFDADAVGTIDELGPDAVVEGVNRTTEKDGKLANTIRVAAALYDENDPDYEGQIKRVADEEFFHGTVRDGLWNKDEISRLKRAAKTQKVKGKKYTYQQWAERVYGEIEGYDADAISEEAAAKMFVDTLNGDPDIKPEIKGIVAKAANLLRTLFAAFRGKPDDAKDLIQKFDQGEIGQRERMVSGKDAKDYGVDVDTLTGDRRFRVNPKPSTQKDAGDQPEARSDGLIELVHWSDEKREKLLVNKRGTGPVRGEERNRTAGTSVRDRIYFGANVGKDGGYEKEAGLGRFRHVVAMEPGSLYNWWQDPMGLKSQIDRELPDADQMTQYEALIKDAGFDGYWVKGGTHGDAAVVFTDQDVESVAEEKQRPAAYNMFLSGVPMIVKPALRNKGWAIITGTKEDVGPWDHPENVAANADLKEELGPFAIEVIGRYEGVDQGPSYIAFVDEDEALRLGQKYGQESVLTSRGFIYSDGRRVPANHNNTIVGPAAKEEPFHSILPNGTAFTVGLDFDKMEVPEEPKKASNARYRARERSRDVILVHGGSDFDEVDFSNLGRGEPGGIRPLGKGLYGFVLTNDNTDDMRQAIASARHYAQKYGRGRKAIHLLRAKLDGAKVASSGPRLQDDEWDSAPYGDPLDMKTELLPGGLTEAAVMSADRLERIGKFSIDEADETIADAALSELKTNREEYAPRVRVRRSGVFDEPVGYERYRARKSSRLQPDGDHPDRISTRSPRTKRATENSLTGNLIVDTKAMKANPAAFSHNMQIIKRYPGFATNARNPDRIAAEFTDFVSENLRWLHDRVPAEIRERSKLWYDGARAITERWTDQFDVPDYSIAGVLAALSPQKDWYQNVSLAERVLDIYTNFSKGNRRAFLPDAPMRKTAARIYGDPKYADDVRAVLGGTFEDQKTPIRKAMWLRIYDEAHHDRAYRVVSSEGEFIGDPKGQVAWGSNVEIAKAITVLENQTRDVVSESMGDKHKVRNFYNNILAPKSPHGDVTIDTHAVAAALIRPLSGNSPEVHHNFGSSPSKNKQPKGWVAAKDVGDTGASGVYGLYADAYRKTAKELGILPRELQSITWEAVRGLFPAEDKRNAKKTSQTNEIWGRVKSGEISRAQAREEIEKLYGGINDPTWYGPGGTAPDTYGKASYEGELVDLRLQRAASRGMGDGDTDASGARGAEGRRGTPRRRGEPSARYAARLNARARIKPAALNTRQDLHTTVTYNTVVNAITKTAGKTFLSEQSVAKLGDKVEGFLVKFQDKMLPVGRMVDEINKAGGVVTDATDTRLREELFGSKAVALIEDREKGIYKNLIQSVKNLSLPEKEVARIRGINDVARQMMDAHKSGNRGAFDLYIAAKAAPERNKNVRDAGGDDAGSGITDAEAAEIVKAIEASPFFKRFQNAEAEFRKITKDTTDTRKRGGLISDEADGEEFYAPLRGHLEDDPEATEEDNRRARTGRGFGARGKEDRSPVGRRTLPGGILENTILQNVEAQIRAEKNLVGRSFLELLRSNVEKAKPFAEILDKVPMKKAKVNGRIRWVVDPTYMNDPNIFIVKEGGKPVVMHIADDRVARALNGMGQLQSSGWLVDKMASFNRYLAMVNTSYNPEFVISNALRDIQTAMVNAGVLDDTVKDGLRKAIVSPKNWAAARKTVWDVMRGNEASGEWADAFKEFRSAGGMTAFQGERDLKSTFEAVRKEVSEDDPNMLGSSLERIKAAGRVISDLNESVENALRLSAYKAGRDAGLSKDRAAQFAKNITVDFNKGGEAKALMGGFYLFYNASIQGTFAMLNAMRSPTVRKAWLGVIAAGLAQDTLMSAIAPEDEDGENIYDKIPDWVKERNLIILTPWTERGYLSIPMPYGFNAAYGLGRNVGTVLRGKKTSMEAAGNSVGLLVDTLSPIGSFDNVVSFLTPTLVDPLVEVYATNTDFAGNPIVPERSPYGPQAPLSHTYSGNTNPALVGIAQWINKLTGGTSVVPGTLDFSPDRMEYAIDYLLGAAGATALRASENVGDVLTGNIINTVAEDGLSQVTMLRKFAGSISEGTDVGAFIEGRDRILMAERDVKAALEMGDRETALRLRQKWSKELRLAPGIKAINRERNRLSKALRALEENPRIPESHKREMSIRLRKRMREVVIQGNKLLNAA